MLYSWNYSKYRKSKEKAMSEETKGGISLGEKTGGITLEKVDHSPVTKPTSPEAVPAVEGSHRPAEVKGVRLSMSNEVSIRFGVVGAGQGGSRIAEVFGALGYPACVINTARQDLAYIRVPEDRKFHMEFGLGGAGKDVSIGEEAYVKYSNPVHEMINRTFNGGRDIDFILACCGGGGGTGSGAVTTLVNNLLSFGLPVGVIYTLPSSNEDPVTKSNAVKTLDKLSKLVKDGILSTLIIVDNAKIERTYPGLSTAAFWARANMDIANILHQFNRLTAQPSRFISLDPMDFAKILTEGNCTIYGSSRIPEYHNADELVNAVANSVKSGLLADEFTISETSSAGVLFAGSYQVLSNVPQDDIDYAIYELSKLTGHAGIYKGIYDLDSADIGKGLVTYTILSGLGVPHRRIQALAAESEAGSSAIESKKTDKSKMTVTDADSAAGDLDRFKSMETRHSPLGKMMKHRGGGNG